MKPDRWQQVEELYHSALKREGGQRAAFLQKACRGDETLRQEVESLLAQQSDAQNFMEAPAAKILAETPSLVGQQIGSYKVLSLLGTGGMGQVYRARDGKLGREVAIKVLPREFSSDLERVRRFEQEARAASALNHPNIITIHEIGQVDSVHYMVMERVEGKTLREVLATGPLPTKRILHLATQVADGLAKAHAAGITHRDLKPENLMITKEGLVKILDFGLAKQTWPGRGGGESEIATAAEFTEPGMLLGTVGYMSPEQASGQAVDFRSDQFSSGAIVYEMVTGERAFARSSAAETLAAIIREEPKPMAELSPKTPRQLRWMIERCLAKDPDDRYVSTRDLARDLQLLRDHFAEVEGSEAALPAAPSVLACKRRHRVLTAIGLAAVVLALLAGGSFLGRRAAQAPVKFQRLTFRHGIVTNARFASDGQTIVYGATFGGKPELYTTRPEGPESRSLDLHDTGIFSISPSGEMAIALGCRLNWADCMGTLARVPPSGGAPRPIMDDLLYADWAPDGKELAVVRLKGGQSRLEYPPGNVLYEAPSWISHPRISPKGDLIAFLDHPIRGHPSGSVCVVDLAGKKKTLSIGWRFVMGLAWRPSGDEVWFAGAGGRQGTAGDGLQAVTLAGLERAVFETPGGVRIFDVSRDGQSVLLNRGSSRAWVISLPPGGTKERDLSWLDYSTAADLSADGKTLLFYEWGRGVKDTLTVYLRKTDGSDPVRLGEGKPLALSPDGRWALVLQESSPSPLTLLPTGTGEQRRLPRGLIHEYTHWAAWSPDGTQVLFTGSEQGHRPRTYVQEIGGGEPRPVTAEGMAGVLLSPDGKLIAAVDRYLEYLCPIAGGEPRPIEGLEDGDTLLQWNADGRSLFLRAASDSVLKIYKLDLANGRRESWKELTPPDPAGLVGIGAGPGEVRLTPDGKSYVYTYWTGTDELYLAQGLK